ncbi:mitochondrial small ribosomal subunit protein uS17m [Leptolyngbya sp. 15MV]|nr:mitochondrial small ribosomal subunit protein uS17m [Leptolyngbya sp. 15MV]
MRSSAASKAGDTVEIVPCRPMSRTKKWTVARVVTSALSK